MASTGTPRPAPSDRLVPEMHVLMAGLAGLMVWELFARLIAPFWIDGPLNAPGLVRATLGIQSELLAQIIHGLTGLVAYPAVLVLAVRPVLQRLLPGLPWPVTGAAYGIGLWIFAMYVMAHLFAGFPPFLDFDATAWASLIGHVAYGVTLLGALVWSERPDRATASRMATGKS